MKFIDKALRCWRVSEALKLLPDNYNRVFDIGCHDGYLLNRINNGKIYIDGCDPYCKILNPHAKSKIFSVSFPSKIGNSKLRGPYDVIFALAVFEHFTKIDLTKSSRKINSMLSKNGRLIVTIPSPLADKILDFLLFLKLIDGQELHQHTSLDVNVLINYFSKNFRLKHKKKFQFGLNNILVFEKK